MISRGDIYYADLRPILQNDKGNAFGPTTIIAPITSQSKNKRLLPTHMSIHYRHLHQNSMILFEQIRTIDKSRLSDYICHMRKEDINQMDLTLRQFIAEHDDENFVLMIGSHVRIKRRLFEEYLDLNVSIL